MSATRSLPVSAAHREFSVKVDDKELPRSISATAISINASVNKIAYAELVFPDGDAASGGFALSDAEHFVPGKKLAIYAGSSDEQTLVFEGLVTKQSLKVREQNPPQLRVECRHEALRLHQNRKDRIFRDQTDSDALGVILSEYGMDADVASTDTSHEQLAQYHCTDWDFILARARANGLLIFTRGKQLKITKVAAEAPKITLEFGATILSVDAELDGREPFAEAAALVWDSAQQDNISRDSAESGFTEAGNLKAKDMASALSRADAIFAHVAAGEAEAQAWVNAETLFAQIDKLQGRLKCEGIATVLPGDWIEAKGLGARFSGKLLITGVRQEFSVASGWRTYFQFGGINDSYPAANADSVDSTRASGLLASVQGLHIGVVVSNEDPASEHRVRVRLPMMKDDQDGLWARVAALDAGDERGFFFRPEIGDEVVVGFFESDPRYPVLLGMLHSSAKSAPLTGSDDNHEKQYKSREGLSWTINDEKKQMVFETPGGQKVELDDDAKALVLTDQHGNSITMNQDGITIESATALNLKAGTEFAIDSGTSLGIKSGTELKLEGSAGAELSSTAITKVKGSLLQLN